MFDKRVTAGGGSGSVLVPIPACGPKAQETCGAHGGRPTVYLHPGRIFVSTEPCIVTTTLGSCVSVCLWDRKRRIGGLNHFLLPHHVTAERGSPRFGNAAVERLLVEFEALGSRAADLVAKVFGGACLMPGSWERGNHLGRKNTDVAHQMLEAARIPIIGEDTGGERPRKVVFHTDTGTAWVKCL